MTVLIVLSVVWAALVVLALAPVLALTGWKLSRTRIHLSGIADDLERIAVQAQPLDGKLEAVGDEVEAIVGALSRVDASLADIQDVIRRALAPQKG